MFHKNLFLLKKLYKYFITNLYIYIYIYIYIYVTIYTIKVLALNKQRGNATRRGPQAFV